MTAKEAMAPLANLAGEKEKTASGALGSGNYISVNEPYGMQGYAYCGTSIRYSLDRAGCTLLKGCTNPAYVPTLMNYCKAQGWQVPVTQVKPGAIGAYKTDHVFFVWDVISASGNTATVITLEGNSTVYATATEARNATAGTGGFEGIGYKKRVLDGNYTVYNLPYDSAAAGTTTTAAPITYKPRQLCTVQLELVEDGYTVSAGTVKSLQAILAAKGFLGADGRDLDLDGELGPNTIHAITAAQKKAGVSADGACGPVSWKKIVEM